MKIQLEAYEATSIAELLLSDVKEYREFKVQWAIKLVKACLPEPTGPEPTFPTKP